MTARQPLLTIALSLIRSCQVRDSTGLKIDELILSILHATKNATNRKTSNTRQLRH
jgi:hypothetical protein